MEQLLADCERVLAGNLNDFLQQKYDEQGDRSYIGPLTSACRRVADADLDSFFSDRSLTPFGEELERAGFLAIFRAAVARSSTWFGEYRRGIEKQDRARHASWRRGERVTRANGNW